MSSNYPDGMTAADHAYLDGVPDDCEHENSYCEGWRFVGKLSRQLNFKNSVYPVRHDYLILEMRCDDCGATREQDSQIDELLVNIKMEMDEA